MAASDPALSPEQTNSTLNQLSTVSDRMAADWGAAKAEIAGMAGQLGKGELGAAFLAAYRQLAAEVADVADQCCQRPSEFAAAGNQAINAFVAVDDHSSTTIRPTPT